MGNEAVEQDDSAESETEERATIPDGYSTPLLNLYSFSNPVAGITPENATKVLLKIAERHQSRFEESWETLQQLIREVNPIELLATSSFYALFKGVETEELMSEEPYTQAHIELLQSAVLALPESEHGSRPALHHYLFAAFDAAKECAESYGYSQFKDIANAPEDERTGRSMLHSARTHSQLMRNWASPQHMFTIIDELFEPLNEEFKKAFGLTARDVINVINGVRLLTEHRANAFMQRLSGLSAVDELDALVERFYTAFGLDEPLVSQVVNFLRAKGATIDQARDMLLSQSHSFLPGLFFFNHAELKGLCKEQVNDEQFAEFCARISLKFGDLTAHDAQALSLHSPITTRPLIQFSDKSFFIPIPGLLHSFSLQIIEQMVADCEELKERYHRRRAQYLEKEIVRILENALPAAQTVTQAKWTGTDGKEYESDFVLVLGGYIVIFEAKSNRVDDSSKRGAPKKLFRDLRRLISDPAEQAQRLASALIKSTEGIVLRSKGSKCPDLQIDPTGIEQVICCSVTLDVPPVGALCWTDAIRAELVPKESQPVIHMTLADLFVLSETLDSQSKWIHYLSRREIWERHVQYIADEEDILVYYLSEGLPVLADEGGEVVGLHLYGRSLELRRYYMSAWVDPATEVPRPRRILTEWFEELVQTVESLDNEKRWKILNVLLDVPYREQMAIEQKVLESQASVELDGNDCENSGLIYCSATIDPKCSIVILTHQGLNRVERNEKAESLFVKAHKEFDVEFVVLIGRDLDRQGFPYDFLMYSNGLYLKE